VSGGLGRGGHLVGDREIGFSAEFNGEPHPPVNFRVSLAGVQRPQVLFRDQKQHSVDFGSFLKVDVGVKPLGDLIVSEDANAERGRARTPMPHPERIHVGAVGEV